MSPPNTPLFLIGMAFLFGACIGSFLNVVIYRLPRDESLVWPGSHCPGCNSPIAWWANIPILSYLALRARCRSCGERISARYPLVEAATGLLFAALMFRWIGVEQALSARLLVDWLLAAALIAITFIDAEHQIIPNAITYPGIPLGLLLAWIAPPPSLWDASLGLLIAGGFMWLLSAGYEWYSGQIGLGMGDVKLVAMLGSFLGLESALGIMVVGSLVGLIYGLVLIGFKGTGRATRIPFGPALALAGIVYLFVPGLLQRVLSLL
ncbi:MAG: prepilin peptidase [bacterium]|nr:prepilin peptidase [bacterium]